MGFILLAKGARQPFFWSELSSTVVQAGLVWIGIRLFGLAGTGIAFFGGYAFYWFLIYAITRSRSGFRWSAANKQIGTIYGVAIVAAFVGWYFLPRPVFSVLGAALTLVTGIHSLRRLCTLVPLARFPKFVVRALERLGIIPEARGRGIGR
jgi:PST family polysaccharide transporter